MTRGWGPAAREAGRAHSDPPISERMSCEFGRVGETLGPMW